MELYIFPILSLQYIDIYQYEYNATNWEPYIHTLPLLIEAINKITVRTIRSEGGLYVDVQINRTFIFNNQGVFF